MASISNLILPNAACPNFSLCTLSYFPAVSLPSRHPSHLSQHPLRLSRPSLAAAAASSNTAAASFNAAAASSHLKALIFDCDGVILESEHLHRQAYNDAFAHFDIRCPISSPKPLYWDSDFYDELQNRIGGGKPKMRWYFKENGWPSSSVITEPPSTESEREKLIDVVQDWKTENEMVLQGEWMAFFFSYHGTSLHGI